MPVWFKGFGAAALIALWTAVTAPTANAESVMQQCGDQWKAAKTAGTTNGLTWPQFLSQCRAQLKAGTAVPTPAQAAPSTVPMPSAAQTPAAGKTTAQCNAEYAASKAAIRASGQTKREFVASCCRAGKETIPTTAAAPAPAPSAAPAPAPLAPAPSAAPTGAGQFASDQQAQARCPSDTVVWVNNNSHVYHFVGTHNYGHTNEGAFMCEADAKAAGNRAAKNERHP